MGLVLSRELPSTYPTLYYKEIGVKAKIRVLPSVYKIQKYQIVTDNCNRNENVTADEENITARRRNIKR